MPATLLDRLADITQAGQKLGFAPETSVDQGLRESIEYYQQLIKKVK